MRWFAFKAMGTTISVLTDERDVARSVRSRFEAWEATLSRFRSDSELSAVNCTPATTIEVSTTLASVLGAAQDARSRTCGLVDPSVGAAMQAWGYTEDFFDVADLAETPAAVRRPTRWDIDGTTLTRDQGVILDLGGIAKGWAADRALADTDAWAVNAGGDIASRHPELCVRIRDPWEATLDPLLLGRGGLATSSTAGRSWNAGAERVHHIIEPEAGRPAQTPVLQASAVADSALLAEAAAKAMILQGTGGLSWADSTGWVRRGLAVWNDGAIYATRQHEVAA